MKKIIFLLIVPASLTAQVNYSKLLDSFMIAQAAINHFNGNVLVAKSGTIIYQKAFGYRNYDTKELLDNNSIFDICSITKQFTALGILQLKERGKLKLTDSLRKYFPELPYNNISIQNMLTHTSGLPSYDEDRPEKWDHKKIAFNKDLIQFLVNEKLPIHFKPGERWEYSNTGYALLASIIEQVSGQTFKDYMDRNIFKPLGMLHTRVYNTRRSAKEIIPDYAFGFVYSGNLEKYILPDSLPEYASVIYLDGIEGDGAIISTTADMLKWDRALKNHTLLSAVTQKKMLSPQSIKDTASKKYYGYGIFLGRNELGNYIEHDGVWPGYHTYLIRYNDDITIIVLSNNESNDTGVAGALYNIIRGKPVIYPYTHTETAIATTLLDNYTGRYRILYANACEPLLENVFEIIKKNGKLYQHILGYRDEELKPESAAKFFYDNNSDIQIEFKTAPSSRQLKAFIIRCGVKSELKKE
jgi:CubicO group peptidase (beta-lactamase class C family)